MISKPEEYVTIYHTFQIRADAKLLFVGEHVKAIVHLCVKEQQKEMARMRAGPGFFGSRESQAGETRINLERPVTSLPASGYCGLCNRLWIAKDPPKEEE